MGNTQTAILGYIMVDFWDLKCFTPCLKVLILNYNFVT